jgi:hypothetical protein
MSRMIDRYSLPSIRSISERLGISVTQALGKSFAEEASSVLELWQKLAQVPIREIRKLHASRPS